MQRIVKNWTIEKICKYQDRIGFPEFQREPHLWSRREKRDLIDSILIGLDIPKLYFYKIPDGDRYDVVDGQQRLWAIWDFYNNQLSLINGRKFSDFAPSERKEFLKYELQVAEIIEAEEEELRLLFLRLQLGLLLNTGEKLKAGAGIVKDFVFKEMVNSNFIKAVGIPARRFAKQTLCAQICINSYWKEKYESFIRTRYVDLEDFFKKANEFKGAELKFLQSRFATIKEVLGLLNKYFKTEAFTFRNRSFILSLYLFVEEMMKNGEIDEGNMHKFVKFIKLFLKRLRQEIKAGFNKTNKELYNFQSFLNNAPGERYQIENRHKALKDFYQYFKEKGKIKGD